jgi:hypothetical protein
MFLTPNKKAETVEKFVSSFLAPEEQLEATLSLAHTGSLSKSSLPIIGAFLSRVVPQAVVVTNRRVLLIGLSGWPSRPQSMLAAYPRDQVAVASWKDAFFAPVLTLSLPDAPPLRLEVRSAWQSQAQEVVDALRGT